MGPWGRWGGGGGLPGSLSSCFGRGYVIQLAISLFRINVFEMSA